MNQVTLVGRLVQTPELIHLPDGNQVSKFNLAIERYHGHTMKEEKKNEGKQTTDFPRISVWGKNADNACKYLHKGALISIAGRITTSTYEVGGERKYNTEIVADRLEYLKVNRMES